MGIYMTFWSCIILAKYFVGICSWCISSSEGLSGISYSIQTNFAFKSTSIEIFPNFYLIKQFIFNYWVNSCLTSFITIIHGFHFSLSGKECQSSCVFAWFSGKDLICPLLIFELEVFRFTHRNWSLSHFTFVLIELCSGFISSI